MQPESKRAVSFRSETGRPASSSPNKNHGVAVGMACAARTPPGRMSVRILAPLQGSRRLALRGPTDPPANGSVIVVTAHNWSHAVIACHHYLEELWPWCIPCICLAEEELPAARAVVELIPPLRHRVALLADRAATAEMDGAAVVRCVHRRPLPEACTVAAWVARRIGDDSVGNALEQQFREAIGPRAYPKNRSSYSREFSRRHIPPAHNWRAIFALGRYVTIQQKNGGVRSDDATVPIRRAREHARRYLDWSLWQALGIPGWEPIMEQFLRRSGVVSTRGRAAGSGRAIAHTHDVITKASPVLWLGRHQRSASRPTSVR